MMIFRPNEILNRFDEFDMKKYRDNGYNTILLDVDNTITPYYQKIPGKEGKIFVDNLKRAGFRVFVFSNNKEERVRIVANSIKCEYLSWAFKPLPFRLNYVVKKNKFDKNKILVIGDQLLTDVLAGKLSGVTSIYVKPLSNVDGPYTRINRKIERFIFKYILHEKM